MVGRLTFTVDGFELRFKHNINRTYGTNIKILELIFIDRGVIVKCIVNLVIVNCVVRLNKYSQFKRDKWFEERISFRNHGNENHNDYFQNKVFKRFKKELKSLEAIGVTVHEIQIDQPPF